MAHGASYQNQIFSWNRVQALCKRTSILQGQDIKFADPTTYKSPHSQKPRDIYPCAMESLRVWEALWIVHSVDVAPCSRSSTSRLQKNLGLADALVLGWLLTLILPAQTHLLNIPVITLTHRQVLCATVFKWKTKTLPAFADERHHTNSLVTAQ